MLLCWNNRGQHSHSAFSIKRHCASIKHSQLRQKPGRIFTPAFHLRHNQTRSFYKSKKDPPPSAVLYRWRSTMLRSIQAIVLFVIMIHTGWKQEGHWMCKVEKLGNKEVKCSTTGNVRKVQRSTLHRTGESWVTKVICAQHFCCVTMQSYFLLLLPCSGKRPEAQYGLNKSFKHRR